MKPRNSPPAVLFETPQEVEILQSYFAGNQPEVFGSQDLIQRREILLGRLDRAKDYGWLPVAVSLNDMKELVVPAVDFAMAETPDSGLTHYQLKPIADFRHEVVANIGQIAA